MQPKRSFNINGSGAGSSYWGGKPPAKKPNLEKINEDYDKLETDGKLKPHGSSKSEDNKFSQYKLSTLDDNRKVKFLIGSSKSDENDYAKSYLVKEKELQDKQRQKQMELKKLAPTKNFLTDSNQAKPPVPTRPSKATNRIKLFEKPMDLPVDITSPINQTYRVPNKISKSLESNLDKIEPTKPIESLTYRVDDETKIVNKQVKPKIALFSNEPKPAKTYQSIHSKNKNITKSDDEVNILPLGEVETNVENSNQMSEIPKTPNKEIEPVVEANQSNSSEPVHRVNPIESVETNAIDSKQQLKKVATPNPKKMKLFEAGNTKNSNKPSSNSKQEIENIENGTSSKEESKTLNAATSPQFKNGTEPLKDAETSTETKSNQIRMKKVATPKQRLNEVAPPNEQIQQTSEVVSKKNSNTYGVEPLKDSETINETKAIQTRMKKVATPKQRPNELNKQAKPANDSFKSTKPTQDEANSQPASNNITSLFRIENNEINNDENESIQPVRVNPSLKATKSGKRNIVIPNNEPKKLDSFKQDVKKVESFKTGNRVADFQALKNNPSTKRISNKTDANQIAPNELENADFAYKRLSNDPESNAVILDMEQNQQQIETPIDNNENKREYSIIVVASNDTQPITKSVDQDEDEEVSDDDEEDEIEEETVIEETQTTKTEKMKPVKKIKEKKPKQVKPKIPKELDETYIKSMHFLSLFFAVCFPFTGLFALYYSRQTKSHFELKETEKTRKILNKLEWILIGSLFLALIFFISLFAFLALFLKWITLF